METRQIVELNQVDQRLEVTQSCLFDSTFNDVNLSNAKIQNASLAGTGIEDPRLAGHSRARMEARIQTRIHPRSIAHQAGSAPPQFLNPES
jgi:uncharacterized protein YjbI with pentapeptide repeats